MNGMSKKPSPDVFLLAMKQLNSVLCSAGDQPLRPYECLAFEDSIAGVEAGQRAGMRVVWVPHEGLARVTRGREQDVLAGRTEDETNTPVFEAESEEHGFSHGRVLSEDGWAEMLPSLEEFEYEKYGIKLCDGESADAQNK